METLIPVINELQTVFKKSGVHDDIQLPQIVAVGSQSSGKSSVLESFVKKSFLPRGKGMVTRCPIVLQLIQTLEDEYCYFVDESKSIYSSDQGLKIDFENVQSEIEMRTDKIPGSKKCISKDPIIIQVYSPNVINLTLVDLPGIVKIPVDDQPKDIEDQIRDLVMEYAGNPNSIILAVSAANADIATSESIKLAKEVDPEGKRTLAVFTKLDLMDKGTDANDVLEGKTLEVKLGLIGVVNRSQQDLNENKSIADAIQYEEDCIRKNYPHLKDQMGSNYLAQRLHSLLSEHIRKCLPDLKKRIDILTQKCRDELKTLGKAIDTSPEGKMLLMTESIHEFLEKFKNSVVPTDLTANDDEDFVGEMNEIFYQFDASMVPTYTGNEELLPSRIRKAVLKSVNIERFASIENAFKTIVGEEIGLFEVPSINCANQVHSLLERIINGLLEDGRFRKLNAKIALATQRVLSAQLKETKDELRKILTTEKRMIRSSDPKFTELLKMTHTNQNRGNPIQSFPITIATDSQNTEDTISYVQTLVATYIDVTRRRLTDYFPKCIIDQLHYCPANEKFKEEIIKTCQGQASALISEPEDCLRKRRETTHMLENLCEATEILYGVSL